MMLQLAGVAALALLAPAAAAILDLAEPSSSLRYWLQHPTLGEAGFDSTVAHAGNPVCQSAAAPSPCPCCAAAVCSV